MLTMPRRLTQQQFIERCKQVHGDKYDFSQVAYVNFSTKVTAVCPKHGAWQAWPQPLLRGHGCPGCKADKVGDDKRMTQDEFIRKAREKHGTKYDYSKVRYTLANEYVTIVCPIHGEFKQTPTAHMTGRGCPKCNTSEREKQIMDWLDHRGIAYDFDKPLQGCAINGNPLRFDFIVTGCNLIIEHQGPQHYKDNPNWGDATLDVRQQRDQVKRDYCKTHGIRLEEIRYDEDLEARLREIFNV